MKESRLVRSNSADQQLRPEFQPIVIPLDGVSWKRDQRCRRECNHYFFDEAGDLTFFGRRSRLLLGTPGCSKTFMLGVARVAHPVEVHEKLQEFRLRLLSEEPYRSLYSAQPHQRKTAHLFHARCDHHSVRMRVLEFLSEQKRICALIAVRRKFAFLPELNQRISQGGHGTFTKSEQDKIYDDLVRKLTLGSMHRAASNQFTFALRGKSARNASLREAIDDARVSMRSHCPKAEDRPYSVSTGHPSAHGSLQVIDYLLWALQRGYERGDWEPFKIVQRLYAHVHDIDDTREKPGGMRYCRRKRPLTPEKANALWQTTPECDFGQRHEAGVRLPESA